MPRIEDTLTQDAIADSLLGDEGPQEPQEEPSEYARAADDLLSEAVKEQNSESVRWHEGDSVWAEKFSQAHTEREQEQPEREAPVEHEQPEALAEQPHAPTPEEVQAGVERLDSAVAELGLNEPADARQFADEFCGAFGGDVFNAGVDVGALGGVMSKTALSALQVYQATGGDLSKMGEIPAQSAQAFAHDLLRGMGVNPRSINVDAMLLARTTLGGMVNFLKTFDSYGGRVTDLAKLNDPQQAEFYLWNFMKAFGIEGQPNRDAAIKFADACSRQLLRVMGKISQVNAQRAATKNQQKQRSARTPKELRATRGITKFQTNSDLFDPASMKDYYTLTERL